MSTLLEGAVCPLPVAQCATKRFLLISWMPRLTHSSCHVLSSLSNTGFKTYGYYILSLVTAIGTERLVNWGLRSTFPSTTVIWALLQHLVPSTEASYAVARNCSAQRKEYRLRMDQMLTLALSTPSICSAQHLAFKHSGLFRWQLVIHWWSAASVDQ